MRIAYISNLRMPTEKAYGIQIAKMCEAFTTNGAKVDLFYPERINLIKDSIFDFYNVKNNFNIKKISAPDFYWPRWIDKFAVSIKNMISARILAKEASKYNYDLYYSRDELPLVILSRMGKNVIFEAHKFSRLKLRLYKYLIKKEIKIISISEGLKSKYVAMGFKPENIIVAPDAVDLDQFDISASREECRQKFKLPLNKHIILYSGHLYDWKGVKSLIYSSKYLSSDFLIVLAGGTEADINRYKQEIKNQNLENKVMILGRKPYKDVPFLLKTADILVIPNSNKDEISKTYTSPLKLFEYMAAKRPIIASDISSLKEILNKNNSVLIEPDNPVIMAETIKNVINNYDNFIYIANNAFDDVKKHSWSNRAKQILSIVN